VLTVGRLQARKGQDQFIRALPEIRRHVPDVLYSIIGDGVDRSRLNALVDELGLHDCVKLQGELQDEQLVAAYQQCELFALPNREERGDIEGFGMVLLEAQACGKPVLAGDSGGTRETLKSRETGVMIDCTTSSRIAAETIRLLTDPESLASMGRLGREWTCSTFDWDVCAERAKMAFKLAPPLTSQLVATNR
jgi:phosphatidylinositol alpha-1,6-mannosyltransferase